jgi:hypothetical protein
MTACVVRVLLMPMNAPHTMTATMTVVAESVYAPMTAITTASRNRLAYSVLAVPKRRCSRGATATLKMATSRPQPVKTRPSLCSDRCIGYGAYPSIVKKPQL